MPGDRYAAVHRDGGEAILWRDFCADLNTVLTVPNLEYAPTVQPEQLQLEVARMTVTLGDAEEARLAKLLSTIRERFRICSVYAKGPFQDFAKSSNSPMMIDHVTRQQFVQCLARLGVQPDGAELELLFRKFDDNREGSVNYVAFCNAVDGVETHSSRLNTASAHKTYVGFRKPNSAFAMA